MSYKNQVVVIVVTACIITSVYFIHQSRFILSASKVEQFRVNMNSTERFWALHLLQLLAATFEKHKIVWFLNGGTLLGCYRFEDIIPWDDDIDIYLNYSQREKALEVLNNINSSYVAVYDNTKRAIKFFTRQFGVWDKCCNWSWPSIDTFMFKESGDWVLDSEKAMERSGWRFSRNMVFPLSTCSLAGNQYPAPYDTRAFLLKGYGDISLCKSLSYSHKTGRWQKSLTVPCHSLQSVYKFARLS